MATYDASANPPADADLVAWIGALRWLSVALLTGLAVAAVFAGASSEGLPVRLVALVVAIWAVVAAVPVHTILGGLQRGLAERDEIQEGTESGADLETSLAPVIALGVYSRVS
jgi:MFS-type transporter involved in bile tolerance (Atg22 family)